MRTELNIELPRTVNVGAIEAELRGLWREASADTAHPVARACMLNLVLFVDAAELETAADIAAELAVHHPSRTILVAVDPGARQATLTAEVSARCHLSFGRRQQICSEQVIIRAGGSSIDDVHGVVIPLLTSDLPTFLWWRSTKWPSGRSFKNIAASCNRVIIDSSVLADSSSGIRDLNSLMHDGSGGQTARFSVADLAWARLTPWRIALAELYDLSTYRRHLSGARRFSLTYVRGTGSHTVEAPASALLAAGWLASRLGWNSVSSTERAAAGHLIRFANNIDLLMSQSDRAGESTAAEAQPVAAAGGSVQRLEIEAGVDPVTRFSIAVVNGCIETTIVLEGKAQAPRILGSGETREPDLVGEEMDIFGRDTTYEAAIAFAAEIAGAIGAS